MPMSLVAGACWAARVDHQALLVQRILKDNLPAEMDRRAYLGVLRLAEKAPTRVGNAVRRAIMTGRNSTRSGSR